MINDINGMVVNPFKCTYLHAKVDLAVYPMID